MTGATMKKLVGIICLVFGFAASASAAEITGTLNFTGDVVVSATSIDFQDSDGVINAFTLTPSDGYFSGLDTGVLSPGYGSAIDLGAPPVIGFLHDFKENPDVATEYDDLTFDLHSIVLPSVPDCDETLSYGLNDQCGLGPFTLAQTADGVSIRMDITGQFVDPTYLDGAITDATGIFTAQRARATIDAMLDLIALNPAQTFSNSYSAQISAVPTEVPEPATLLTFGAGTALLAAHRRRRAKKNAQA
jgi:hypothetical protein